jgi:hypothetical protein
MSRAILNRRRNGKQRTRQQQRPSIEEKTDRRIEERAANQGAQTASAKGVEESPMDDVEPEDFLRMLVNTSDIESDEFEELEDILAPHLANVLATTYYDPDDRQKLELLNLALSDRIIKEREHGRLCTGPFLEVAQGVSPDEPVKEKFKPHERRGVRAAIEEVRTALQYLGIDHIGLDKVADTKIENKTTVERMDGNGSSKSRLGRATSKVFGK